MYLRPGVHNVEKGYCTGDSDSSAGRGRNLAVPLVLIDRSWLCAETGAHLLPSLHHYPTYDTLTLLKIKGTGTPHILSRVYCAKDHPNLREMYFYKH